jgi:hypothetical protein
MTEVLIAVVVLLAIVAAFVVFVSQRPSQFRVSRSTAIAATPPEVFSVVNDFHNWDDWSPWSKRDPNMKVSYSGPEAGTGTVYEWSSRGKVGAGRMTILESKPFESIAIELQFFKPGKTTNSVEFAFEPDGNRTRITWNMTGRYGFFFKVIGLFMNFEKMCGNDFEKGLAQLKSLVEVEQAPTAQSAH